MRFEEFVDSRGRALRRFAYVLCGDRHRAEDLVQSALARAFRKWDRVSTVERPESYVQQIVVREYLTWWRLRSSAEVPVALPAEAMSAPDPAVVHAEREATWRLLGTLPRKQRAVVVLRYYEDLSDAEIAAILDCAPSTVRSNATRALATLRSALTTAAEEARS